MVHQRDQYDGSASTLLVISVVVLLFTPGVFTQPATLSSQWDGVFTIEQAARGRVAYAEHCSSCHGPDLRGVPQLVRYPGQSASTPALIGDTFARNWEGLSLGDLHERIRTSMPQQNPGSIGSQTVSDILAFMLDSSGYPPGASELSSRRADLGNVLLIKKNR